MITSLIFSLFVPFAHADGLDKVLSQAGLSRSEVRFSPADLEAFSGTELQPPIFKSLRAEPLRIPTFARVYREYSDQKFKDPTLMAVSAYGQIGLGVRRTLTGDPLAGLEKDSKKPDALTQAIAKFHGGKLTVGQRNQIAKQASRLPEEVRAAAAYLLLAEYASLEWRAKAFAAVPAKNLTAALAERLAPLEKERADDWRGVGENTRMLIKSVDFRALAIGGMDLAWAVSKATERLKTVKAFEGNFVWETPRGRIEIRGNGASTYSAGKKYLLILDFEGDDTYETGAGSSFELPVSVVIDLRGNDKYKQGTGGIAVDPKRAASKPVSSFGAGVFGYGILVDMAGNDSYRAFRFTQGRGDFGMGLLWDLAGDDTYDCYAQCQASADFGVGLLLEGGGKDKYEIFQQGQGFGGLAGTGLLVDGGLEADEYLANTSVIDFPSLIDEKYNVSFVQGAAAGYRADVIDGYSLSGGFGALLDGGGDNKLQAGFFAQGVSYWSGVGLLIVGAGKDEIRSGKYAGGASAHFGIGILYNAGGNDFYHVDQELGLGHGHDYGIGMLIDDGGDDVYEAPNFALGCASAQGLGIFWDRSGADTYRSTQKEVLGCASLRIDWPSTRFMGRTTGLFIDEGEGKNKFETPLRKGSMTSGAWTNVPIGVPPDLAPEFVRELRGAGVVAR